MTAIGYRTVATLVAAAVLIASAFGHADAGSAALAVAVILLALSARAGEQGR